MQPSRKKQLNSLFFASGFLVLTIAMDQIAKNPNKKSIRVVAVATFLSFLFSKRLGPSVNGFCNLWDQGTDTLVDQVLEELDGLVISQIKLETLFNL